MECIEKEWIESISKKKRSDKILIEKVIRALLLLEGLSSSGLDFVFKGGTALMLLLGTTKRLSIDIDIIVPDKDAELATYLDKFIIEKGFTRYEEQKRKILSGIEKEHYKLFFTSTLNGKESHILLDILKEKVHYKTCIPTSISSNFFQEVGASVMVVTPDFNNILGDKLTAFAPTTTGIPYRKKDKEMGMEIIKQMYDVGCLFDNVDDMNMVKEVFSAFATIELRYRGDKHTISDVLDDISNTALSVCFKKNIQNANFDILKNGVTSIKSYIFSESFHLDKAVICAAKAAYLATLIRFDREEIVWFDQEVNMKDWTIGQFDSKHPLNELNKLNKLKKSNPEAFHYWYQIYRIVESL